LNFQSNDLSEQDFETIVTETKLLVLKTIGETLIDRFDESTEDVVQEVYFRVFKALKKNQFKGEAKLSTWVYTIAKNESNRMNSKRIREEEKAKKYLNSEFYTELIEAQTEKIETSSFISTMLDRVPLAYRKALSLYLEGMSMDEIAKEMSVKQGTVKSRLFRAKIWIRENLLGEVPPHGA